MYLRRSSMVSVCTNVSRGQLTRFSRNNSKKGSGRMSSPQRKRNHFIAVFAILVVFLTLTNCQKTPPPETKQRVILIFSDVTSSLVQSESEQVATLTSSIINSLLPGTRYFIYPVQVEGQKLEPMDEGTIPIPD